jgi:ABC-type sulfate transport system permease component
MHIQTLLALLLLLLVVLLLLSKMGIKLDKLHEIETVLRPDRSGVHIHQPSTAAAASVAAAAAAAATTAWCLSCSCYTHAAYQFSAGPIP